MKKESKRNVFYSVKVYFYLLIILLVVFISLGVFGFFSEVPFLSPLFPEFAPFDASVSVITNWAPEILDLEDVVYVCEGKRLSYFFSVSDLDGDVLTVGIDPEGNPRKNFFVSPVLTIFGNIKTDVEIFSLGILGKADVGIYPQLVSVSDGYSQIPPCCADTKSINIEVIEKNNVPAVENIGVQTLEVYSVGENSTFYKQVMANDVEDGNQNDGVLSFSLEFLNYAELFSIAENGIMTFTPRDDMNLDNVNLPLILGLRVCVEDTALSNPHAMIQEFCDQDGYVNRVCRDFSLTILEDNRAPIIGEFNPTELSFDWVGTEDLYFNITGRDPDGTVPDIYWYVDDVLVQYTNASNFSEFIYNFGCGVSGNISIRAVMTDGLLNDSIEWFVLVGNVACPVPPSGDSSGAPKENCKEKWACDDWSVCQNVDISLDQMLLSKGDYSKINELCDLDNFQGYCGFQLRGCFDSNKCNIEKDRPEELQHCYFVENPSCSDGVKNCHDGGCEILTDCGGTCSACATCSDEIKNQGENGIDCGGPCPSECTLKDSLFQSLQFVYIVIFIVILLIIIVIVLIVRIFMARNKVVSYDRV